MIALMKLGMRLSDKSLKDFASQLTLANNKVIEASSDTLRKMAEMLMLDSQEIIPRDTGTLSRTAYQSEVTVEEDIVKIHFGYASPETDQVNPKTGKMASMYAVQAHEDFHYVGEWKFLENPVVRSQQFYLDRLKEALEDALA